MESTNLYPLIHFPPFVRSILSLCHELFADIWKPVNEEKKEDYSYIYANATNIHLLTNSSGDNWKSIVRFKDPEMNRHSGGFTLRFKSRLVEYRFAWCSNYKTFSVSLPTSREKVWTIQKRGYRMDVFCNGKKVLNETVSSEVCDNPNQNSTWNSLYWERRVDKFYFPNNDKATLFYYLGTVPLMFMLTLSLPQHSA